MLSTNQQQQPLLMVWDKTDKKKKILVFDSELYIRRNIYQQWVMVSLMYWQLQDVKLGGDDFDQKIIVCIPWFENLKKENGIDTSKQRMRWRRPAGVWRLPAEKAKRKLLSGRRLAANRLARWLIHHTEGTDLSLEMTLRLVRNSTIWLSWPCRSITKTSSWALLGCRFETCQISTEEVIL